MNRTAPARRRLFAPAGVLLACGLLIAAGPAARNRVLVLESGRVYRGAVREHAHGVEVAGASGRVVLPREMIRVNARTLDDAYFQLRSDLAPGDADGRAKLANWCLTNGLPDRAREELLAALDREPDRDDWRRTLRRVETAIAARAARAAAPAGAAGPNPLHAATGGVSPATTALFAGKAEPILLARCGNAACHGRTGSTRFRLTSPSRSATVTRRNLSATLPFVGDGTPAAAPLLTACTARGDRRGRTPFSGRGGADSYRLLAAWCARVAAERPDLAAATPAVEDKPGDSNSRVTPVFAEMGGEATPEDSRPVRPDAFDPAAFNRRFAAPPPDTP